jgi:integrase
MPSLRNGLKFRDGRPRWEPSPAARKAGIKGVDLKDEAGAWLERGAAIAAADARALWAKLVREAAEPGVVGDEARQALRATLEAMPPAKDAGDRLRRSLVDDLVQLAHARLGEAAPAMKPPPARRTVQAMVDGYFADVDAGLVEISDATRKNYRTMSTRILRKFSGAVAEIDRPALRSWLVEMYKQDSVGVGNLAIGAMGALLRWASWQGWIGESPATKLGRQSNPGRRIIITVAEELSFTPWCDAHGFADVGDGLTLGLWTGARPHDLCAVDLATLQGRTWRFVPNKGKRRGREAVPGILPRVQARVDRRARDAAAATVKPLGPTPFLWNPATQRRHDTASLGGRFREAKAAYLLDGGLESFQPKHVADSRDTCVTRLYLADVDLDRIPGWTGHAPNDRDDILRQHYLTLLDEAALEDAAKLEAWAKREGLAL